MAVRILLIIFRCLSLCGRNLYPIIRSISMNQRSRSGSSSHVAIARNNANIPAEGMSIFRSIRTQGIATSQPDHSGSPSIFRSIRTQGTATSQPEHSERPLIFRSIRTPTSRPDHSESPSNLTVIPYNSNTPAVGRFPWQAALRVFEAALPIANIIAACLIMRGLHTSNIFTEGGCSRTS